jgi:hypothetical protein
MNELFEPRIFTLSESLHSYKQFDYNTNHKFDVYNKYIENNSNNDIYDFEINENDIFLGNKNNCVYIYINNNVSIIDFFGFQDNIESKNTKILYLLSFLLIFIFHNTNIIEINNNTKISYKYHILNKSYNRNKKDLSKLYFLKYGKYFSEYFFDFEPVYYCKKKHNENIEKRNNILINRNIIMKTYKEFNYKFYDKVMNKKIRKIFGKKKEITLKDFLDNFTDDLINKYYYFFFDLIDLYFILNFNDIIIQTFQYKINNKNEFLHYINEKIQKL